MLDGHPCSCSRGKGLCWRPRWASSVETAALATEGKDQEWRKEAWT